MITNGTGKTQLALTNRGFRPETIRRFRVTANLEKQAWEFPLGKGKGTKFKAFSANGACPKYWTSKGTKIGLYHLDPCRGQDHVFLVEGEFDVIIMHQAGLPSMSFTGGAGTIPKGAVAEIRDASIDTVHIIYDRDEQGQGGAAKVQRALVKAGVQCLVHELPAIVGPGGDVTSLYNIFERDDDAFVEAIQTLPEVPVDDTEEEARTENRRETQAAKLVKLCHGVEFFHSPDGVAYATLTIDIHFETHRVKGRQFREWLCREFYLAKDKPPSSKSMQEALGVLEAKSTV